MRTTIAVAAVTTSAAITIVTGAITTTSAGTTITIGATSAVMSIGSIEITTAVTTIVTI